MPSEFQFMPGSGTLPPFGKVDVDVIFTPLTSRRVRSVSECIVTNGPSRYVITIEWGRGLKCLGHEMVY